MTAKGIIIATIVFASIIIAAGAATPNGGNWPSFILNYNNTRYQPTSPINASNVGQINQNWFIQTAGAVTSTPVVWNGTVYFGDWSGDVYSVNITTGNVNWETSVNNTTRISSTPEILNGKLYVAFGSHGPTTVDELSASTGNILWSTTVHSPAEEIWASPIVYNGRLYVGATGNLSVKGFGNPNTAGIIYAINSSTGKVLWNYTTLVGNTGGAGVWGSIVVDPKLDSIYFGTGNSYVNGSNSLYSSSVFSLNATTGLRNWVYVAYNSFNPNDLDFGSTPNLFEVTINNVLHNAVGIGSKDGSYYLLNRNNGTLIAKYPVGGAGTGANQDGIIGLAGFITQNQTTNPELFIPAVYYTGTSNGVVEALYPSTNTTAWRFFTPGVIYGSVGLIPGVVLVGDDSGNLYALNSSNGNVIFDKTFTHSIEAGITEADGYIFVPTSFAVSPGGSSGVYAYSLNKYSAANSTTTIATTTVAANDTIPDMISTLEQNNFTNVTANQNIASASLPGVIFAAFNKDAYGTNKGGNVLVLALPLGDEFSTLNITNQSGTYTYTNANNATLTGTITFKTIAANSVSGGSASGNGPWITWKELVGPAGKIIISDGSAQISTTATTTIAQTAPSSGNWLTNLWNEIVKWFESL